jgi:hypothetical protein
MIRPRDISDCCRNIFYSIIFFAVTFILYACPFSSTYKLDKDASIPVDEALLGKWATMVLNKRNDLLPVKMILSKKNDTEYNIDLTGDLNELKKYKVVMDDSIRGSAYMSMVADRPFLNIEIKGQTYISAVVYKNDTLSLLPLADGFTAKYIKSDTELRNAVEVHVRTWVFPRYDEQFCLKNMVRVN